MPTKRNITGKPAKTVTELATESQLRFSAMSRTRSRKAADREQEEKEVLWFANLLHGGGSFHPPQFPATQRPYQETAAEKAAFEQFVQQFPRRRFAALRNELDKAARSKLMDPEQFYREIVQRPERRFRNRSRTSTPIQLYRSIWEMRERLRDASRTMNFVADEVGLRRPPLQICEGCGKLFILARQDQRYCTDRCGARQRVARARADKRLRDDINKDMVAKGAAAVARDLDFGSEEKLARFLRRTFSEAEVQRVLADRRKKSGDKFSGGCVETKGAKK
jgi:hypothetical protein